LEQQTIQRPLLIGVGPGSSGTRSLFAALQFLDISGVHYHAGVTKSPQCKTFHGSVSDLYNDDSQIEYFGDTPFSYSWVPLLRKAPHARYIMTQVGDATQWAAKRLSFRGGYCSKQGGGGGGEVRPDCLVPLAFLPKKRHYDLYALTSVTPMQLSSAYNAYEDLVKCLMMLPTSSNSNNGGEEVVEEEDVREKKKKEEKLLWIDFREEKVKKGAIWSKLLSFLDIDFNSTLGLKVMGTSFPRVNDQGCFWSDELSCCDDGFVCKGTRPGCLKTKGKT
jgi:hypothetical protein